VTSFVRLRENGNEKREQIATSRKRHLQVGSNGGLVLGIEPRVHKLVHERRLSDTTQARKKCEFEPIAPPRLTGLQHAPTVAQDNNLNR